MGEGLEWSLVTNPGARVLSMRHRSAAHSSISRRLFSRLGLAGCPTSTSGGLPCVMSALPGRTVDGARYAHRALVLGGEDRGHWRAERRRDRVSRRKVGCGTLLEAADRLAAQAGEFGELSLREPLAGPVRP
jgi:hypothetical protein